MDSKDTIGRRRYAGELRVGNRTLRQRYSMLGHPYWVWERDMPHIEPSVLNCVIYLYPTESDALVGERAGGTGFLVGVRSLQHENVIYHYAVTNSHVIREGNSPMARINTVQGDFDVLPFTHDGWEHHPDGDDIAVHPVSLDVARYRYQPILTSQFLTKERAENMPLGPGDDVFMVGRFVNHEGKQRNLPTVRFGSISMMPWEPVLHPRGILQESFLVEMRSMSGYSGSPVFLLGNETHEPHDWRFDAPILLGVDWGHVLTFEPVLESDKKTPAAVNWFVKSNTGVANVVPAWKLQELLDCDTLTQQRAAEDAEIQRRKERSPVELDAAPDAWR